MTVRLVVLYTHPDDPDAWDADYLSVHGPLVDSLPGLDRWEAGRVAGAADGGEHTYYRTAELWFPDEATMQAAFASEQGQATTADYQRIAPPGSRMFIAGLD